jgi:hypothetical protein
MKRKGDVNGRHPDVAGMAPLFLQIGHKLRECE